MLTIYKFKLNGGNVQAKEMDTIVPIPKGPTPIRIFDVGLDRRNRVCIWALCNMDKTETIDVKFAVRGTGHDCGDVADWPYLGSVNQDGNIWHVFAEPLPAFGK